MEGAGGGEEWERGEETRREGRERGVGGGKGEKVESSGRRGREEDKKYMKRGK